MRKKLILLLAVLMALTFTYPAAASDAREISLVDAVKMAMDNSKSIRSAELDIDSQEKTAEDVRTDVKYTPIGPGYNDMDKPVFKSYYNTEYTLKLTKKQLESSKEQLVIDTKTAYYNCLTMAAKKEAQEKAMALAKLKLAQEKARNALGMSTEADINAANTQLATDQASLEDVRVKLDKAYSDLNTLLGLDQGARPVLTSGVATDFSRLDNVDLEVSRAMDNSLDVWTARESAELAAQLKIFETWFEVGKNKEEKAYIDEAITKDKVKVQLRDFCNSINYMVEKNNQLDTQKKELEESCRILKLQYDLGMITKDVLLNAEAKLLQVQGGMSELAGQYATSRDKLDKYQGKFNIDTYLSSQKSE